MDVWSNGDYVRKNQSMLELYLQLEIDKRCCKLQEIKKL